MKKLLILFFTLFVFGCPNQTEQKPTTQNVSQSVIVNLSKKVANLEEKIERNENLNRFNLLEERLLLITTYMTDINGEEIARGSRGVLMDSHGLAIVAGHALQPPKGGKIIGISAWALSYGKPVKVYYAIPHPEIDIGIIRVPIKKSVKTLKFSTEIKMVAGDLFVPKFNAHNKGKEAFKMHKTKILKTQINDEVDTQYKNQACVIVDTLTIAGQSGSPVFDRWGNLAGIVIMVGDKDSPGIILHLEDMKKGFYDLIVQEEKMFSEGV